MKRILTIMALAGMGILVVSPARMSAQETGPAAVLTSLLRVFTSDSDAALALFTDDAVVRIIPPPPGASGVWSGKEEIKQFLQFAKSQNAVQEIVGSPTVNGNNITATVMVTVNDFRKWGIGPVEHTYEAVVEGGKFKSFDSIMAPAERGRVGAAAQAYMAAQGGQPPAGMPRTGNEQPMPFFLIIMSGMLAALVGLALKHGTKPFTS